jgi:hypothetical protein
MRATFSDAELAAINAAVADAPALTSEQIADLRRILRPGISPARPAVHVLPVADATESRRAA